MKDYINKIINGDCLEVMKQMPDKCIDLVVTDPPYGINIVINGKVGGVDNKSKKAKLGDYSFANNDWDKSKPTKQYFDEIFRVSKNQIIFGANHFIESMPINSSCWLVWDKDNEGSSFADCELAWTSFKTSVRRFKYRWNGMIQQDMKNKEARYHPTQKPVPVMEWLIEKYSQPGQIILDAFAGSGSTLVAAQKLQRPFIGIEISPEYCEIARQRLRQQVLNI